ncbi:subunit N of NADH:ubiquinone oxidoreductase [Vitreoscilla sp. C1]|uniref:NADH-quinone oxidoreductase subunit NuoN n=1 Tax=Vitreoscilla sp. (strain C1) TaxID=96942 RepID=UPI00148E9422|nr:NADH-quinone oxidoreductase subunit NuoN [Vitreoscilla sp. C1]QJQ52416.1 subunit N of NADH:ubiquinone oxidoreductase [Vitreoscilla sp. C1]
MNWAELNLTPAIPEITLLCALGVVLLVDLFLTDRQRGITYALSLVSVALVAAVQLAIWQGQPAEAFNNLFVNDGISQVAKLMMYLGVFLVFIYSRNYLANRDIFKGEFYTLTLFALLGMNIMVSANHFLTLYVGLELLSLAMYAMVALRRDNLQATEAALKYFVLGALASGLLLYGISFVYGATGHLQLNAVLGALQGSDVNPWLMTLGLIFIVVGVAFKLGVVPFHMWVPDVYEGAPTAVTAFIGSAPKIAATVFAFRIVGTALPTLAEDWSGMFALLAVASLFVGNLAAIMQTNMKRMLAYSTVSHMGFVMLAFLGGFQNGGYAAALYYSIVYMLTGLVAFGVLMALSNKEHECEKISDLAGLNQKSPFLALMMLLAMFSMAGIPPLMGFYAKLSVLQALVATGGAYLWVAVFAVVMSLIGAFYYLRVVKVMYFDEPENDIKGDMRADAIVFLGLNGLALLVLGILPTSVVEWCVRALQMTL